MYQVYIVDDDEIILDEIVNSVPWLDNGYEVIGSAINPISAVEEISRLRPHVVFCDLKMPAMDGNELISKIRANNLDVEFVMLSAFGTFEDSRAFFLQDGFDYILKPLQQEEVQIVLERLSLKLVKKYGRQAFPELTQANPAFYELIQYITGHFNEKFTLEWLGKQFNLNPNYICNLFSKYYDSTLTRFVTGLRMNEAVKLMKETSKAFKEIAIDCGYNDYYYFCKIFKETYGVSPSQYRIGNL